MMTAANMGHSEVVQILIEAGANAHLVARDGQTAANLASAGDHQDIMELLNAVSTN